MLSFPLIVILGRTGETIGPLLVAVVLAILYAVLFSIYRVLALAASTRATGAPAGEWMFVVSAVSSLVAGIVWLVWVWQIRPSLASSGTYTPLLIGAVSLWAALASGALIQRRLTRDETRRVAI
jgi:TRAP-type C4-dicarboxylate transport system permease large subunit